MQEEFGRAFSDYIRRIGQPHNDDAAERAIQRAKQSYAAGRTTLEQLEQHIDRALAYLHR